MTATNTGNATLLALVVQGQAAACAPQLPPAQSVNCTVLRPVDQAAFNAWDESEQAVQVDATVVAEAAPYSDVPTVSGNVSSSVALQSRQDVAVTVSVQPSTVTQAGMHLHTHICLF